MRKFFFLFWFIGFGLLAGPVEAVNFSSPAVPVSRSTYDLLQILESHDLIHMRHKGIRPYTRNQVAVFVSSARDSFQQHQEQFDISSQKYLRYILKKLSEEFTNELALVSDKKNGNAILLKLLPEMTQHLTFLQESPRSYFEIPTAIYQPLVNYAGGRHFANGFQTTFETAHHAYFTKYAAVFLNPSLQFQMKKSGEQKIFLQEAYASLALWNHQMDAGRKTLVLGQGRRGGVVLTNHARPPDMIQVQNMVPWQIPYLGTIKYIFFLGDLGPEQLFPHSLLSGIKLSLSPHPLLEFALTRALIFGGKNAPAGSFSDTMLEYFGIRPGDINQVNLSNSILGFEARGKIPMLKNLEVFAEFYFDDLNTAHLFRSFIQDTGIFFGAHSIVLDHKHSWFMDLEAQKDSTILYKHGLWRNGWALNGRILGLPLGPDSESISIHTRKIFDPEFMIHGTIHMERSDSDVYGGGVSQGRAMVVNGMAEYRYRFLAGGEKQFLPFLNAQAQIGYERVQNFNFVSGRSENFFLASVSLVFDTQYFTRRR